MFRQALIRLLPVANAPGGIHHCLDERMHAEKQPNQHDRYVLQSDFIVQISCNVVAPVRDDQADCGLWCIDQTDECINDQASQCSAHC